MRALGRTRVSRVFQMARTCNVALSITCASIPLGERLTRLDQLGVNINFTAFDIYQPIPRRSFRDANNATVDSKLSTLNRKVLRLRQRNFINY
jgi:hypothetical protein